jgi:hypothetical protein
MNTTTHTMPAQQDTNTAGLPGMAAQQAKLPLVSVQAIPRLGLGQAAPYQCSG